MITEKTKYYLSINGMRWLTDFRQKSGRRLDPYNCCTQLHYQIMDLLAGHQRGLTRAELQNKIILFPNTTIKDALIKIRKAGYITTASSAGVKPVRKGYRR